MAAGRRTVKPVEFLGDDDLAAEAGGTGKIKGEVEHILLVLGCFVQQVVPFRIDDHVAGRASERAFTSAFDIDPVAMGDFEHRQTERRIDLVRAVPSRSMKIIVGITPSEGSGRGAKSSASIAAANAGSMPGASSTAAINRSTNKSAACADLAIVAALALPYRFRRKHDDRMRYRPGESPLGAQPRRLEQLLPLCHRRSDGRNS